MLTQELEQLLSETAILLSDQQKQQLVGLVEQLDKWNKAYNLTSIRNPRDMLVKHIMDSLVISPYLHGQRIIDVGTGPGLPGLPLAIANPEKEFVLLDSLGKRIRFITQVCHQLKIQNVTPVQSRVEAYQPPQGFDIVLSRAFASLQDMLSWCAHLPRENGKFYALKGMLSEQEVSDIPQGFTIDSVIELEVPRLEGERHLVIIDK